MEKLQLPHAKLFYFSAELYKNSTITENEKLKMKEMVINDEPQIFELLERYQSNGSEQEFIAGLLGLLRPHQKQQYQVQNHVQQQQPEYSRPQYQPPVQYQEPAPQPVRQQQQQQQPQQQQQQYVALQQVPKQREVEYQEQQQFNQPPTQQESTMPNYEQMAQFIEKHPDCPDEISSPLGLKLLKRKQKTQKASTQIKDYLKPYKIDQEQQ